MTIYMKAKVEVNLLQASRYADTLKSFARNDKRKYVKRELFEIAAFLDNIANYFDDEKQSIDD